MEQYSSLDPFVGLAIEVVEKLQSATSPQSPVALTEVAPKPPSVMPADPVAYACKP